MDRSEDVDRQQVKPGWTGSVKKVEEAFSYLKSAGRERPNVS
jgi:hypothetical protein